MVSMSTAVFETGGVHLPHPGRS